MLLYINFKTLYKLGSIILLSSIFLDLIKLLIIINEFVFKLVSNYINKKL